MSKKLPPRLFAGLHALVGAPGSALDRILLKDGLAVATDGYALAVRTMSYAGPARLVDAATAKAAAKEGTFHDDHVTVGKARYAYSEDDPATYTIRWQQIIPDPNKATITICLDAGLLKKLADAITSDGLVTLAIAGPLLAVHVQGNEGHGAIMPVRI